MEAAVPMMLLLLSGTSGWLGSASDPTGSFRDHRIGSCLTSIFGNLHELILSHIALEVLKRKYGPEVDIWSIGVPAILGRVGEHHLHCHPSQAAAIRWRWREGWDPLPYGFHYIFNLLSE
uniref:Uncharacterized protein n=1 Tax=Oryza barthii TaxID=65489 RepID=A0A0D3EMM2_9ORYZ